MRYLFLFLLTFSFSIQAGYFSKISDVCSGNLTRVSSKYECGSDCIEVPKDYNVNYSICADIIVNDIPVYSKNEINPCTDQADCEARNLVKTCLDEDEAVKMALNFSEIYCTKFLRFDPRNTGVKIVQEDATLKAAYLTSEQTKITKANTRKTSFEELVTKLEGGGNLTPLELSAYLLYLHKK